jgi:aminoglycoside phosphotransferase (APT) family kinase protein
MDISSTPTEVDAARILSATGRAVRSIRRFPSGLAHYVYDARTADDQAIVIRLTRSSASADFVGAVYWHERLAPLGVPLPYILFADTEGSAFGFPALILERLPGIDLGEAYPRLTEDERRAIAGRIAQIQRRVGTLPLGSGFGYAHSYEDPSLAPSWVAVLEAHLQRSRERLAQAVVVAPAVVDRVAEAVERQRAYLARIEPVPFLHDTTTKNVIVHEGRLSGIVDVDTVCFGDPLRTPALTRMSLLALGYDADYVDAWIAELNLTPEQEAILALYAAIYCVDFLAEIGHAFNRDAPPPVEPRRVRRLLAILDDLMAAVEDAST